MFSIIIATRNRSTPLRTCIESICSNRDVHFEIIIVDQSDEDKSNDIARWHLPSYVNYYHIAGKGISIARNFGIKKSKGEIIVFLDDDCIVPRNWLRNIKRVYDKNPIVWAVFGSTKPFQPTKHRNDMIPSTYIVRKRKQFRKADLQNTPICFIGNAMSIRESAMQQTGLFQTWLGIGSVGYASEELEWTYRVLLQNKPVMIDPSIIVYHDRWISYKQYRILYAKYSCGHIASFTYHAFFHDEYAMNYLIYFMKKIIMDWYNEGFSNLEHLRIKSLLWLLLILIPVEVVYVLKGMFIGSIKAFQTSSKNFLSKRADAY